MTCWERAGETAKASTNCAWNAGLKKNVGWCLDKADIYQRIFKDKEDILSALHYCQRDTSGNPTRPEIRRSMTRCAAAVKQYVRCAWN